MTWGTMLFLMIVGVFVYSWATEPSSSGVKVSDEERIIKRTRAMITEDNVIAVVEVEGVILTKKLPGLGLLGGATYGEEMKYTLAALALDTRVKGVMIRMSTPGGTVTGSEYLHEGVKIVRNAGKPVHVYVEDHAMSGGVYTMVAADFVSAAPTALVGSVGVISAQLFRYNEVTEYGSTKQRVRAKQITARYLHAGKGKTLGDPFNDPDSDALQAYQDSLNETYGRFVRFVSKGRKIPEEQVRAFGARVFSASAAKEAGLIDDIASYAGARLELLNRAKCVACSFVTIKNRSTLSILDDLLAQHTARSKEQMVPVSMLLRSELQLLLNPTMVE